jgi:hypothetical protein
MVRPLRQDQNIYIILYKDMIQAQLPERIKDRRLYTPNIQRYVIFFPIKKA